MPFPEIGDELRIKDDAGTFQIDVEIIQFLASGKVYIVKDTATKDEMFALFTANGRVYRCIDIDGGEEGKEPWQA